MGWQSHAGPYLAGIISALPPLASILSHVLTDDNILGMIQDSKSSLNQHRRTRTLPGAQRPGRISSSIRQRADMMVSHVTASGNRDANHPIQGEKRPARSPMAQPPATAGMGFSALCPDGVARG